MKRPFRVTLFVLAVLSLALFNLQRFTQALSQAELMRSLGLDAPQIALAMTGAAWSAGFGAAAIGLYRLQDWARRWTLAAIVLYQINVWLIRLGFARAPDEALTRPADAAISLAMIVIVWVFLFWPGIRRIFR